MPPNNTPEERPSTPTQPSTPTSHWSSNVPSTPQHEPPQRQQIYTAAPGLAGIRRQPRRDQRRQASQPPPELSQETLSDLRSLDYISIIDENLICPICRLVLINPITTTCEHVFCKDCFDQSYQISATCPIDRSTIRLPQDIGPTHRLILNQLDGLEVKCPNTTHGCQKVLARSMVQNHVEKYCGHAMVNCPEKTCEGKVLRKDINGGCLHYASICPDCAESLLESEMELHRGKECSERKTGCEKCGVEILRCGIDAHENECEEAIVHCKWNIYGCSHKSKRRVLIDHAPYCDFRVMGPVVEMLKEEINALRSEVQFLNEKDKAKDRRIKFLESDRSMTSSSSSALGYSVPDMSALPGTSPSNMESPYDSRDQYLLSLLESQESKVDQLSVGMTELEAKQTMMLFNETIPIKEQLAELRSAQGVLGMHVRWLMNFRLQERRPGATAGPSNETKPGDGSGGPEFQSMRPSDTMRELITKL